VLPLGLGNAWVNSGSPYIQGIAFVKGIGSWSSRYGLDADQLRCVCIRGSRNKSSLGTHISSLVFPSSGFALLQPPPP
jgi:hypothetical protein